MNQDLTIKQTMSPSLVVTKTAPVKEIGIALLVIAALIAPACFTEGGSAWLSANGHGLFLGAALPLLIGGGIYLFYNRVHFCRKRENTDILPCLAYALLLSAVVASFMVSTGFDASSQWQGMAVGGGITLLVLAIIAAKPKSKAIQTQGEHL